MKKLYIFAVLFIVANIADIALTWIILNNGGVEVNPIMNFFISSGFGKAVALKVGLPVIVAAVLIQMRRVACLAILAIVFTLISAWNMTWVLI